MAGKSSATFLYGYNFGSNDGYKMRLYSLLGDANSYEAISSDFHVFKILRRWSKENKAVALIKSTKNVDKTRTRRLKFI
jgi:hypothetical protein